MEKSNNYTLLHRLLHWIIAIAMAVIFITGFLRMTWMNKNQIVSIIESKTQNIELTKEIKVDIAKTIRKPMWQWHEIFAYIVIITFVIRIVYMFTKGIKFPNPFKNNISIKEKMQGYIYIVFYVFVFISAFTGVCIKQDLFLDWRESIEMIHKSAIIWFPIFVILHFGGLVLAEYSEKKGIVSKIISGK